MNVVVTEKICSGFPSIPKTSLTACLILPRCDSCLAEILALHGVSNSLLVDLKEVAVETQKCRVLSCAALSGQYSHIFLLYFFPEIRGKIRQTTMKCDIFLLIVINQMQSQPVKKHSV